MQLMLESPGMAPGDLAGRVAVLTGAAGGTAAG